MNWSLFAKVHLYTFWFVADCAAAGFLAYALGFENPWSGSRDLESVFLFYAFPLSLGPGLFHLPSLALVGALLFLPAVRFRKFVIAVLAVLLLSSLVLLLDEHGGEIVMFAAVDAAFALPAALLRARASRTKPA